MPARCIICDYDLRELDPAGACPECGTPIERSLKGDLLRYADQAWTRRIELGMRLISAAVLGLVSVTVIFAAGLAIGVLVRQTKYEAAFGTIVAVLGWPLVMVAYGVPVTLMVGLWLATTPEPRELNTDSMRPAALRALSLLVIPVVVGWISLNSFATGLPNWPWLNVAIAIAGFVIVVAHMTMFNDWLLAIDRRCVEANEKRRSTLLKYRKQGLGCAAFVLIITIGSITLAVFRGNPLSAATLGIMVYVWFAVLSFARGAAKRIAIERAIAS